MYSSYELGQQAAGSVAQNPYIQKSYCLDREDRLYIEVQQRRWDAGFEGKDDPYPEGWAG